MDKALQGGIAHSQVYDARDALVEQYADLARDKDLIAQDDGGQRADPQGGHGRPDAPPCRASAPAGPARTADQPGAALRAPTRPPAHRRPRRSSMPWPTGFGYALDGTTGAPLWHVPLGLASPFAPQAVPGEPRCSPSTRGSTSWSGLMPGPARSSGGSGSASRSRDPPLLLGNQLAQVLPSGKLLLIGLESGELQTTVNLGRPLARAPVHDESGQHLYILGRQDCLFVLAREPLACVGRRCTWATWTARSPVARRGWAGSWWFPRMIRSPTAGGTSWSWTRRAHKVRPVQESRSRAGPGRRRRPPGRSSGRPATRGATKRSPWATMPARRRFARSRG